VRRARCRAYRSSLTRSLNVVYVSRQLGHAHPNVTLEVYAHLFQQADHAAAARAALDASHAAINGTNGNRPQW
jgi:integrase